MTTLVSQRWMSGATHCWLTAKLDGDQFRVELRRNDVLTVSGVLLLECLSVASVKCCNDLARWEAPFATDCAKVVDAMERYNRARGNVAVFVVVAQECGAVLPVLREVGYAEAKAPLPDGGPWLFTKAHSPRRASARNE